jgi:tetratricopeptide (TPR) repeat protein
MAALTVEQALQLAGNYRRTGQNAAAEGLYRQILLQFPQCAEARHQLGVLAFSGGRQEEAVQHLREAVACAPDNATLYSDLGTVLGRDRAWVESIRCFEKAVALRPDYTEARLNLGRALLKSGRVEEAISAAREAVRLRPEDAEAHYNLANALFAQRAYAEAGPVFDRVLALKPNYYQAHSNLGNVYFQMSEFEKAAECHQRALAIHPDYPEALGNLGSAYLRLGKVEEAKVVCQRALALRPDAPAWWNWSVCLLQAGDLAESLRCCQEVIAREPDFAEAHLNIGIIHLLHGNYEEGWKEYQWRWRIPEIAALYPDFLTKLWDGKPIPGQTLLLHAEQGFGDTIQFLRYVPLVRAHSGAGRILLECPPVLVGLVANCGWDVEIIPREIGKDSETCSFDFHCPLLSLPMVLQMPEARSLDCPYLFADPDLRHDWRRRLGAAKRFRIGLAWFGNPANPSNIPRSISAEKLKPLTQVIGATFYSLRLGPPDPQAASLFAAGLVDLTKFITDFADTAALMSELDLIITVDTATAHLAGALGRPVWTMIMFSADWRWGLEREDCPWYPTMRLFRQCKVGDWDEVVQRVADELRQLLSRAT